MSFDRVKVDFHKEEMCFMNLNVNVSCNDLTLR